MHALTTSAILTRFSSRVDGSLSFGGVTPELTSEEKVALMNLHNKNVKLLIQPVDDTPEGLVDVKGEFDTKTPSQRLRSVLFVLWKATEEKRGRVSFDIFYVDNMNRLIESVKSTIPEAAF